MDARTKLAEVICRNVDEDCMFEGLDRLIDDLLAAFPQIAGWRDISEAPKDQELLLFCPGINSWQRKLSGEVVVGAWFGNDYGAWFSDSCSSMEGYESTGDYVVHDPVFPTHFIELPVPPTDSQEN